jgi:apolipoprotein N-acyltransferase
MSSRLTVVLWAVVAGVALSQAYLFHGAFAWLGVVALGLSLSYADGPGGRRNTVVALVVVETLVGVHCWGFLEYGYPLYLATILYMAASGGLLGLLLVVGARSPRLSPLRVALAWSAVEWLHQLGGIGFPLFLGATQVHLSPIRPAIAVVGSVGLSALMVGLGLAFVGACRGKHWGRARLAPLVWMAALAACAIVGRWQPGLQPSGAPATIAVAQGAVPSWLHHLSEHSPIARNLVDMRYFRIVEEALAQQPLAVLIPESAYHRTIAVDDGTASEALFAPSSLAPGSAYVMSGAYREQFLIDEGRLDLYNSVLLFDSTDPYRVLAAVDKGLLAPISEGHFTPGEAEPILSIGGINLGVSICWESMYPRLARSQASDAGVLGILTNDAGFGWAPVSVTHARQGWSRAVENGRPLVRAAQSGISFVVDQTGEMTAELGLFESGVLTGTVQPFRGWTWFTRFGHWVGAASLALSLLFPALGAMSARRARERRSHPQT